ncbi:hypothetical protein B0H67DRAFT_549633 [Lasiosphaeris hirsuta]|uniref:Uncharacterized protein n=1 Tax=Lasiosphaeris hirsuta TaxID=260670 RepID=A0AA40BCY2_9PEZI|nr:hypothetical protein B0H67DRAFT_549633 [Lasiosphaeris hirsuta]
MQPDSPVQQWLVEMVQHLQSQQKELVAMLKQLQQDVASKISLPCPAIGCRSKFGSRAHLNRHIRDFASKPVEALLQKEHKKAAADLGLPPKHDQAADIEDYAEADLHNGAAHVFRSGPHPSPLSGPASFWSGPSQLPQRLQMFSGESDQQIDPRFLPGNNMDYPDTMSVVALEDFDMNNYEVPVPSFSREIEEIDIEAVLASMSPDDIPL